MRRSTKISKINPGAFLPGIFLLGVSLLAASQNTSAQSSYPDQSAAAVGEIYKDTEMGSWTRLCVKLNSGKGPCHIYQLILADNKHPVAEVSLFKVEDEKTPAVATFVTPLKTLLTPMFIISIDGGAPRHYPYSLCDLQGCYVTIRFTVDEIVRMKNGNNGSILIEAASDPGKPVALSVSFEGFAAAFDSL